MLSIGQQLSRSRTARDLTIEDVAFHTRIPAARLRDMENDDLSRFANLTYARGFLKLYSQFLELDIQDYLEQFNSAELAHASGHEYVQMANVTQNLPSAAFNAYGGAGRPALYIFMALVIAGGAIFWWNQRDKPDDPAKPGKVVESPPFDNSGPGPGASEEAADLPSSPAFPDVPAARSAVDPELEPVPPAVIPGVPPADSKPPRATVVDEDEVSPIRKKRPN